MCIIPSPILLRNPCFNQIYVSTLVKESEVYVVLFILILAVYKTGI